MQINDLRKIKRFKDIIAILAKYGFDDIVQHLDTPGSDLLRRIHPPDMERGTFERIRAAIEDLGPTFIKFGQVMSLRPDMLPRGLLNELEKLQDDVPELGFEEISVAVEESLGCPIREVFSMFHVQPVAAASLSQVHRAVLLKGGDFVAVKVQRPDIVSNMKLDLDILEGIAGFLDQQFVDVKHYDLPGLVKVIRRTLMKELDFLQELQNMEIARSFSSKKDFYIPQTYRPYSSERLLVMEHVEGAKLKEFAFVSEYDRVKVAKAGLNAGVKQILEDGFFHADPHPGNLILMKDKELCLVDWGMVGRLTEKDRFLLIELLKAVVEKDSDALLKSFLKLCDIKGEMVDPGNLERELLEILDNYHALPVKDIDVGQFLLSMTDLLRIHNLQLPRNFVVMIKALVTAEGSARLVYPDLDIISEVSDYIHKLAGKRYRPDVLWRRIRNTFAGLLFAQRQIPYQIGQVVNKLEKGKLGFTLRLEKLDRLLSTIEHASNRLTAGIITGSIIIGSSMIITTGIGPYLFGFPALGVVGYLLSVIIGMYLIFTILRGRK